MKMHILPVISLIFACLLSGVANADQSDITFGDGAVLLICTPGTDQQQVDKDVFELGFPKWIEALQSNANEGKIIRAHYLGKLREGVFAVVGGDSLETARANANAIIMELDKITLDAFKEVGKTPDFDVANACRTREIGPVAILPK